MMKATGRNPSFTSPNRGASFYQNRLEVPKTGSNDELQVYRGQSRALSKQKTFRDQVPQKAYPKPITDAPEKQRKRRKEETKPDIKITQQTPDSLKSKAVEEKVESPKEKASPDNKPKSPVKDKTPTPVEKTPSITPEKTFVSKGIQADNEDLRNLSTGVSTRNEIIQATEGRNTGTPAKGEKSTQVYVAYKRRRSVISLSSVKVPLPLYNNYLSNKNRYESKQESLEDIIEEYLNMAGLEKNYLEFIFDIKNIQLNHEGRYYLKLTVKSSHVEHTGKTDIYDKLRVQKGEEVFYENSNTAVTEVLEQAKPNKTYKFTDHKFTFYLPKGFCKNDNSYDVRLEVTAYQLHEHSKRGEGKRVGEGTFAIYPRTNAPKVKHHAALGENLYKTADRMTLLRTLSTDNLNMHCGRLEYMARFRKIHQLPKYDESIESPTPSTIEPTPREPSPKQLTPVPTPPAKVKSPETKPPPARKSTPPKILPPDSNRERVLESPLPMVDSYKGAIYPGLSQVSQPGREEVMVIFHGAANLPLLSDGRTPIPFGSLSSHSDDALQKIAPSTTRATYNPTHRPTWEEAMVIEIDSNKAPTESIVLKVCDATSKEVLVKYRLPVSYLKPFHHYHLELVQPQKDQVTGVRLFTTIVRKTGALPIDHSSPNYVALEVLLRGVREQLQSPLGSLIAVGRMVTDYFTYKRNMLSALGGSRPADISVTTISFPSPHPSSFTVPPERSEGHPQITLPGKPPEQPQWNHPFIYCNNRDKATLFTPGAAVVFEFYQPTAAISDTSWKLRNPIGFSVVLLEPNVYKQLVSAGGRIGVRVEGLPIQQPDSLSNVSDLDLLPELGSTMDSPPYVRTTDRLPRTDRNDLDLRSVTPPTPMPFSPRQMLLHRKVKRDILPIKDGDFPPHDAMENILPEYQYIFVDPDRKRPPPAQLVGGPETLSDNYGQQSVHLMDYQMRELEKYRTAVHKMGQDILTLRQQVRELEAQNSQLRRELSNYNDTTKLLMDSQDLDGLTKPELAARYVAMKQKVSSQSGELKTYKDRVQKLQNDLIQKNDQEKQYKQMSHAHKSQNELVQKLQDKANKVRRLEDAIRKQEKVIEKLEKIASKNAPGKSDRANDVLMDENKRLRQELDVLRDQQPEYPTVPTDDVEKLELYEKLDKAESRIQSLERQLTDNARKWSRDRSDLLVRLQESEHGFRGSPVGYSYPKLDPVKQYDEPRRYSKPLKKSNYNSSYY